MERLFLKTFFLIFVILFTPFLVIANEDINSYQYLKLRVTNSIEFSLIQEENFRVDSFKLDSHTYPQSYLGSQTLKDFDTSKSDYKIEEESGIPVLIFLYDSDSLLENNKIENIFTVESSIHQPKIKEKIKYPIDNLDSDFDIYLEHKELIDVDEKISRQASALAQGEDDLYIIASKIAKWIREDIDYDLSTITQNPNQKSSEVFKSKKGVCREITNLYISMLRSLGIPARVVSGYAYTNSQEVIEYVGSPWGGHAWAEVYIGTQWVPFDLTYNQYGYVDASHVIIDKSSHLRTTSAKINASGLGFSLTQGSLEVKNKFDILEKKDKLEEIGFSIKIDGPNQLGFGSYGYLESEIINEKDYYQILFLNLAKTKEIISFDNENRMIIFEPNEKKTIYYRYKIPEDLSENFIYTFPFTLYNEHISSSFNISVKNSFPIIEKSFLPQEVQKEKVFSSNPVIFDCNFLLEIPENKILCSVKNTNNFEIADFKVCVEENCENLYLGLNERESFIFLTKKEKTNIEYSYNEIKNNLSISLEKPKLDISTKKDNKVFYIEHDISNFKEGINMEIILNNNLIQTQNSQLGSSQVELSEGNNTIKLILKYKDIIIEEQDFETYVEPKLNLFEKIIEWIKSIF